ncbi:hypothetical protein LXA43DRAFT_998436 [Ganoderma leucocontextum]|nr:hypothetical protein LXA43DRAFT_998436 [Ganoderma leucocontextum]
MFPPTSIPVPGEVLLITDELLSPASFLLHRLLAGHLKEAKNSTAVLISVSEDIGKWKAVAGRSNLNLANHLDSRNLFIIEAMPLVSPALESSESVPLRRLYDQIHQTLSSPSSETEQKVLVILDDLSSLEWMGISVECISRFVRAVCSLCQQKNAAFVLRHHVVTAGEPDELLKRLLQSCHYHIDVFPLSSGRSGSVSGQAALHCGPATAEPAHALITRSGAVQYRLTDSGGMFFDRGTGNGVL